MLTTEVPGLGVGSGAALEVAVHGLPGDAEEIGEFSRRAVAATVYRMQVFPLCLGWLGLLRAQSASYFGHGHSLLGPHPYQVSFKLRDHSEDIE